MLTEFLIMLPCDKNAKWAWRRQPEGVSTKRVWQAEQAEIVFSDWRPLGTALVSNLAV